MFSSKGQASFEMVLVVAVIMILAMFALGFGLKDTSNPVAYMFLHNNYNYYKLRYDWPLLLKADNKVVAKKITFSLETSNNDAISKSTEFNNFVKDVNYSVFERTKYVSSNILLENKASGN